VEECAEKTKLVLESPEHGRGLALEGKEHVRRHFLTPRLLRDWLVHFNELEGNGGDAVELAESLRGA
jgi:trehalose synthase